MRGHVLDTRYFQKKELVLIVVGVFGLVLDSFSLLTAHALLEKPRSRCNPVRVNLD